MGWGSATGLFDGAVDVALDFIPGHEFAPIIVRAVVEKMYKDVDWADWDTQDESKYWYDHLIHVLWDLGEVDPEYYAEVSNRI